MGKGAIMKRGIRNITFLQWFFIISLFCVGLFHEFSGTLAAIVLIGYLGCLIKKNGHICFQSNATMMLLLLMLALYCTSILWAVDSGMAVFGVFKFLPVILFAFVWIQTKEDTDELLKIVPFVAVIMTVVSAIFAQIPGLKEHFTVAGRLAGFFQYSNTFAILLLIALIILGTKEKLTKTDWLWMAILVFGILYSGSRTVFLLLVISSIVLVVFSKNKRFQVAFSIGFVGILVITIAYALVTDNFDTIGRFLTVSLKESTFVGRILYVRDALPLILKRPFGLGYGGYYYIQQSVQTGLYTVRYIHNDFLQIALDIGWLPVGLFVWIIIRSFFNTKDVRRRLLLFVMTAHSCFDFNLQFVAMYFILLSLLDVHNGKQIIIRKNLITIMTSGVVIGMLCCYISVAQILAFAGKYEMSNSWYSWNTENDMKLFAVAEEPEDIEFYADRILSRNEHIYVAYNAKAAIAFSEGKITDMMQYSKRAIQEAPLQSISYNQYCYFLIHSISLYQQAGDMKSAKYCQQELEKVVKEWQMLNQRLSKLGTMIKDQPNTEIPDEILKYVKKLK